MSMNMEEPPLIVHSVAFGPGGVEITYQESRHQSSLGERVQTIILKHPQFENAITDLLESVYELVEEYAVAERNPPDRISTRRQ